LWQPIHAAPELAGLLADVPIIDLMKDEMVGGHRNMGNSSGSTLGRRGMPCATMLARGTPCPGKATPNHLN